MSRCFFFAGMCLVVLGLMSMPAVNATAQQAGASLYKRCVGCHGTTGAAKALGTGLPLKGQSAADIRTKLTGYQEGSYGFAKKGIMTKLVKPMTEQEIQALAEYIAAF